MLQQTVLNYSKTESLKMPYSSHNFELVLLFKSNICACLYGLWKAQKLICFLFFLDSRAFSAGVSRRTWFTHVTEIKTVLSIKLPEIAASTVDYRSALKWECPKNVSCLGKNLLFVLTYVYVAVLKEKNYFAVMWLKPVSAFIWRGRSMNLVHNFRPVFTDF